LRQVPHQVLCHQPRHRFIRPMVQPAAVIPQGKGERVGKLGGIGGAERCRSCAEVTAGTDEEQGASKSGQALMVGRRP